MRNYIPILIAVVAFALGWVGRGAYDEPALTPEPAIESQYLPQEEQQKDPVYPPLPRGAINDLRQSSLRTPAPPVRSYPDLPRGAINDLRR